MFPFKLSLNASTLFPFNLNIKQQVDVAAQADYDGLEIWVKDIESYLSAGSDLTELKQYIEDAGIEIVNAIAFFPWADADSVTRQQGFQQAEREMQMLKVLGCPAVAAAPFGNVDHVSLASMAEAFTALVELGRGIGVEPYLEFWGRAKTLSTLGEVMYVALQSNVPDVKFLLDPFHMYTGGSHVNGLRYLKGSNIGIVHVNDYPAQPAREVISDSERVFPGDGIAPCANIAQILHQNGYQGYLSLELFLSDVGNQSALDIATQGLQKSKQAFSL